MFIYFYLFIRIFSIQQLFQSALWIVNCEACDRYFSHFSLFLSAFLFVSFDFEFLMQLRWIFRSTKPIIIREKRCYEYELSNFHLIFFHFVACMALILSHRKSWPAFVFILTCKWDCLSSITVIVSFLDSFFHDRHFMSHALCLTLLSCPWIFKNESHLKIIINNIQRIALYTAEFMN